MRHGGRTGTLLTLLSLCLVLAACWPGARRDGASDAEAQLYDMLRSFALQDTVTVAGFRLEDGKTSPETEALDEALLSAAVRAGVSIRPDDGVAGSALARDISWRAGRQLPTDWRRNSAPLVAAGLVRPASPWVYLRLQVAHVESGANRHAGTVRLAEKELTRMAAARQARLVVPATALLPPIELELHVLVRRDDGGFPRLVPWVEGEHLQEGDRLQLRLRTDQDCDVFVLLYRSGGERAVLHSGTVFADRWVYSPGENTWETLSQADEVYTLYVLAAHRIEDDKGTMWEQLADLQTQGRVEKFRGLDLVDATVRTLLQRTAAAADSVVLLRGAGGVPRGKVERFVYSDGNAFDSHGDLLSGRVIARAYSAEVQFR